MDFRQYVTSLHSQHTAACHSTAVGDPHCVPMKHLHVNHAAVQVQCLADRHPFVIFCCCVCCQVLRSTSSPPSHVMAAASPSWSHSRRVQVTLKGLSPRWWKPRPQRSWKQCMSAPTTSPSLQVWQWLSIQTMVGLVASQTSGVCRAVWLAAQLMHCCYVLLRA